MKKILFLSLVVFLISCHQNKFYFIALDGGKFNSYTLFISQLDHLKAIHELEIKKSVWAGNRSSSEAEIANLEFENKIEICKIDNETRLKIFNLDGSSNPRVGSELDSLIKTNK